ncbi:MAG: hypothetical protein IPO40_16950 [Fibrobacteres bacterium]|nr:hypothetical protein [Fibrobacterota bacterium]
MKNEKRGWLFVGNALTSYVILVGLLAPFCAELLTNFHAVRFACSDRNILQTLGNAYELLSLPVGVGGLVIASLVGASMSYLNVEVPWREAGVCLVVGLVVVGNQMLNANRLYCVADTHRQVAELIQVDPQDLSNSKYSRESSNWQEPMRVKASTFHKNPCFAALRLLSTGDFHLLVPNMTTQPIKADCDSIFTDPRITFIGPKNRRHIIQIDRKTGEIGVEVAVENDDVYKWYEIWTYAKCEEQLKSDLDRGCEVAR